MDLLFAIALDFVEINSLTAAQLPYTENMKNLDQIKEEYATSLNDDYGTYNWQSLISGNGTRNMEHHHDAVAKLYAKEVAKEALKNASENATYFLDANDQVQIVESSITSEENIPKI